MLLDSVLDNVRSVAHVAEVGVNPAHHLFRAMAELTGDGVKAHGCSPVEGLEPGSAICVSESLGAELAGREARPRRNPIKQPVDVLEWPLGPLRRPGRHQESAPALKPGAKHPSPQNGLQLRPERDYPVRGAGLEAAPAVRPNGDGLPVEGDVVQLEARDFPETAAGEEEERHQDVSVGGVISWRGRGLFPAEDPPDHDIGDVVGAPYGRFEG